MKQGKSTLQLLADEFVLYKRSLGYVYKTEEIYLRNYTNFVIAQAGTEHIVPEKSTVNDFLEAMGNTSVSLCGFVSSLREFSRYLILRGHSNAYMIPSKTVRKHVAEPPYFFTEAEISRFFEKIDEIELHSRYKGREIVIPVIFRLLYCCGLRSKEIVTLPYLAVHLKENYLDIEQSKGPKSRRIFISLELSDYLLEYDNTIKLLFPERIYFFPNGHDHYQTSFISTNFWRFWKKAYPDFPKGSRPRAYDLRHHFAWANLNRWAAEGLDLSAMLPYLMRYMGHNDIRETLYYFHFVPEFFPTFHDLSKGTEDIFPEVPYEE